MKQKRIGVIGWLFNFDNEFAKTVAACDINEDKVKEVCRKHPGVQGYTDYRKMLDSKLDAVVISSPNWLHAEMAIFFMKNGVNVFLEKPMGVNRKEIDQVLEVQRKTGMICALDFEMRVSAGMERIREIVASGEIGNLHGIEFIHHRGAWVAEGNGVWRTDPKRSGGLFFMEICHGLDMMRFMLGELVQVQCFAFPNVLPQYQGMPDNVTAHFWFEKGGMGSIISGHTSSAYNTPSLELYDAQGHDMRMLFLGTGGALRMDCIKHRLTVTKYVDFHPDAKVGKRVEMSRIEDFTHAGMNFFHDIGENHLRFFKALASGKPHHQDTYDAWKTHVACLAAEKSATSPDFPRLKVSYK